MFKLLLSVCKIFMVGDGCDVTRGDDQSWPCCKHLVGKFLDIFAMKVGSTDISSNKNGHQSRDKYCYRLLNYWSIFDHRVEKTFPSLASRPHTHLLDDLF